MKKTAAAISGLMLVASLGTAAPVVAAEDPPKEPKTCEVTLANLATTYALVERAWIVSTEQLTAAMTERDSLRADLEQVAAERDRLAASNARKQARIERLREKLAALR